MKDVQIFVWNINGCLATLEVRHQKYEMLLNVVAKFAEKVRAKMAELNNSGIYPNNETTPEGGSSAQFIISGGYNWNSRWRDLRAILDQLIGIYNTELENETEDQKYTIEDWLTDCSLEEGIMVTCPHCNETYWSEDGHPAGTNCPVYNTASS